MIDVESVVTHEFYTTIVFFNYEIHFYIHLFLFLWINRSIC